MHYNFDSFNKQNSSHQTEQFTLNRTVHIEQNSSEQFTLSLNRTVHIEQNSSEQLILNINVFSSSRLKF